MSPQAQESAFEISPHVLFDARLRTTACSVVGIHPSFLEKLKEELSTPWLLPLHWGSLPASNSPSCCQTSLQKLFLMLRGLCLPGIPHLKSSWNKFNPTSDGSSPLVFFPASRPCLPPAPLFPLLLSQTPLGTPRPAQSGVRRAACSSSC